MFVSALKIRRHNALNPWELSRLLCDKSTIGEKGVYAPESARTTEMYSVFYKAICSGIHLIISGQRAIRVKGQNFHSCFRSYPWIYDKNVRFSHLFSSTFTCLRRLCRMAALRPRRGLALSGCDLFVSWIYLPYMQLASGTVSPSLLEPVSHSFLPCLASVSSSWRLYIRETV